MRAFQHGLRRLPSDGVRCVTDGIDPRWVSVLLEKNETIRESGVAAVVLTHPAAGIAELATNKFAQHGLCL